MKKYFYLVSMLAACMLGTTSCKDKSEEDAIAGKDMPVSITLSSPELLGANPAKISDGTKVDKLVYAVYDENGAILDLDGDGVAQMEMDNVTFPTTVSFNLMKGETYKFAFWAQDNDCAAYNTADLSNITIDYAGYNNDESRDAFYAVKDLTVSGGEVIDVELKRPFAQINVGITTQDYYNARGAGFLLAKTAIEFSNAASTFNLLTGDVADPVVVSYDANEIPKGEPLTIDEDGDGVKEKSYIYASMSYILVDDATAGGAEKATLDNVKITMIDNEGDELEFTDGLSNIPVQRNWRTNIVGQFLTSNVIFNISIDPAYEDDNKAEYNVNYADYNNLLALFTAGGNASFYEDLEFDNFGTLIIPENVEVVLNMNGRKLINSVDRGPAIRNNGILTIIDGTFDNLAGDNGVATQSIILNSGELIIEGGTFGSDNTFGNAIENRADGNVTINGGTFTVSSRKVNPDGKPYAYVFNHRSAGTMTINDATVNTEANGVFSTSYTNGYTTGELIVNGGEYQLNGAADCLSHYMVYCPYGKVTLNAGDFTWYQGASSKAVYIAGSGVVNVEPACNRYGDAGWLNY